MPRDHLKAPSERYPLAFEFANTLPDGTALASATVSAVDMADGSDATSAVLQSATATINGTQALFIVYGGTAGRDYKITVVPTLDTGSPAYTLEETLILKVRDRPTLSP